MSEFPTTNPVATSARSSDAETLPAWRRRLEGWSQRTRLRREAWLLGRERLHLCESIGTTVAEEAESAAVAALRELYYGVGRDLERIRAIDERLAVLEEEREKERAASR